MTKHIVKSEDVIGVSVENAVGENLGEIEEILIDKLSGKVAYVVLSFGGFLGMGDKLFALPWEVFDYSPEREKFVINIDKEQLKNAPGFDKDHWPDVNSAVWSSSMREHYATFQKIH